MVLTRTSNPSTTINTSAANPKANKTVNMISFETRGSASFDAREKKFGGKYSNKNRNSSNRDEFIMLQRPTPIILAKPAEPKPAAQLHRSKDENSKPLYRPEPRTQSTLLNKHVPTSYLLEMSNKQGISEQQAILTNVSQNLKSTSGSKFDHTRLKENVTVATKDTGIASQSDTLTSRLTTSLKHMSSPVPVMDESLSWKDSLVDYLSDQADFLVVGVLGKRGTGKSTVMSLLAGSKFEEQKLFRTAGKDLKESAQHRTTGIQAFVTSERTILLDVQPLLSSSVLDKAINLDKKHFNNDFKYYENYTEIQSIELACFVMSVCDVVLVTEDWFVDTNLMRILQTAEMLIPNMSQGGSSNTQTPEEAQWEQQQPHIVYVLNKSEHVSKNDTNKMKFLIDNLMRDSKLIYKGSIADMTLGSQLTRCRRSQRLKPDPNNVNFVVLPKAQRIKTGSPGEFIGMPSLEKCVKYLTKEILTIKRNHHNNLNSFGMSSNPNTGSNPGGFTEKKWFVYANKVWDSIRKSSLITEYNRLMT